jgi:hypothetical protein
MAHIITAVIGSGVLSLAWSVAQLGWVGGPVAMVFFAGVTAVQSSLLADCYIFHDPERGVVRNRSYVEAVRLFLGERFPPAMSTRFFFRLNLCTPCAWSERIGVQNLDGMQISQFTRPSCLSDTNKQTNKQTAGTVLL